MSYLGTFHIDDYVGIPAATHRFSSGAAYAPTVLTYSIYEEATAVGLDEDVDMTVASPFDAIVGCYWVRRQLTAAAGFEAGKNYMVVVKATVDSVSAISMHTFQVEGDTYAQVGVAGAGLTAIPARTVEGALDEVEVLKVLLAAMAGKATGGGTTSIAYRDQADTVNRIALTVDASGNRSASTLNVT